MCIKPVYVRFADATAFMCIHDAEHILSATAKFLVLGGKWEEV